MRMDLSSLNITLPDNIDYKRLWEYLNANSGAAQQMVNDYFKHNPQWQMLQKELRDLQNDVTKLNADIKDIEKLNDDYDVMIKEEKERCKIDVESFDDDLRYDDDTMYFNESFKYQRIIDINELRRKKCQISAPKNHGPVLRCVTKGPSMGIQTNLDIPEASKSNNSNSKISEDANDDADVIPLTVLSQNKTQYQLKPMSKGPIERKPLYSGDFVYASFMNNDIQPYKLAIIKKVFDSHTVNRNYNVQFCDNNQRVHQFISGKRLAYNTTPPYQLTVGERVIAYLKDDPLMDNSLCELYSGTVAEPSKYMNNFRYLIFFDKDAHRYVKSDELFLIVEKAVNQWEEITDTEYSAFIKKYIKEYPERPLLRLRVGVKINVRFHNKWESAKVIAIDASLIQIEYLASNMSKRKEWIYRGSNRLYDIHKEVGNKTSTVRRWGKSTNRAARRLDQRSDRGFVEWNTEDIEDDGDSMRKPMNEEDDDFGKHIKKKIKQTARKSTAKMGSSGYSSSTSCDNSFVDEPVPVNLDLPKTNVEIVKLPVIEPILKAYVPHNCGKYCLNDIDEYRTFFDENPFLIPIILGWRKEKIRLSTNKTIVTYKTPCGRRLRNIAEVIHYLRITESNLDIDHFSFSTGMRFYKPHSTIDAYFYVKDITNGLERQPISCINTINAIDLGGVIYNNARFPHSKVKFDPNPDFLSCCDCTDNCANSLRCDCQQLTVLLTDVVPRVRPANPGYAYKRLHEFVMTGIFECNSKCSCNSQCQNRVVQNGIKCRLQLFRTLNKGWGVRVLHDVPKGTFLCTYAAQILNEEVADIDGKTHGDEYLADLDYIDVCEHHKEGYESDIEEPGDSDSDYNAEDDDDDDDDYYDASSRKRNSRKRKCNTVAESFLFQSPGFTSTTTTSMRRRPEPEMSRKWLPLREYFGEEFSYSLDAKREGNIGRYLNHSCDPNCMVQNVFVDTHDMRFPWVSFFAKKHITAFSELTWDYNYEIGSVPGKKLKCFCGSSNCSKRLL